MQRDTKNKKGIDEIDRRGFMTVTLVLTAGGGPSEVLAGGVGGVHDLLVRGVLHRAARAAVDDLKVQTVGPATAGNYIYIEREKGT